jgi:trehalose 6-phosphate synthase/phosphatase
MAAAINQGLLMDPAEKIARHTKLYKVVTTHTSYTWAAVLVKMLLSQMGLQGMAKQTPYIPKEKLQKMYLNAKKRLFLFDYDVCYFLTLLLPDCYRIPSILPSLILFLFQGTLSPIVKVPSAAIPSEAALEALEKLSADPLNLVYIISGRDSGFLEQHLGHLKNVGFSAEHGGFFRERKSNEWTNLTKSLDMSWMSEVEEIFRYYTEVCAAFLYMKVFGTLIFF